MKFLDIPRNMTLLELSNIVGERNLDYVLVANGLSRSPNIGQKFENMCNEYIASSSSTTSVTSQAKSIILNTFTQDADIFELAALGDSRTWTILTQLNTFPGRLRIPEYISLPDSVALIGNGINVTNSVYDAVMESINNNIEVDPAIFNTYSVTKKSDFVSSATSNHAPKQWFNLPWGKISLYSSIANYSVDFPVYPESLDDTRTANYSTMPDLLFTYEPWQIYNSSGPRSITFKFHMHRDMWSGDHRDGQCQKLIDFCRANCYADYNGAAVNTALVTLYMNGEPFITGIMTNVNTSWDGPIGLDGWYLEVTLELSITEVSPTPISFNSFLDKSKDAGRTIRIATPGITHGGHGRAI